jgi:hypothetical protein
MARKQFLVFYPTDGSKRNIGCAERDSLLLSRQIKQVTPQCYRYVGEARTYHAFADLEPLRDQMLHLPNFLRHYLEGAFIVVDPDGKKHRELLETPEALADRMTA